jgi:DNA-binding XRE family transcriptional regulator
VTTFRNVNVDPAAPISDMPYEAIHTAMSRHGITSWKLLAAEIDREPWGRVARIVEQIAGWNENYGVDRLFLRRIAEARERLVIDGRRLWAGRIRRLRERRGLTLDVMAGRIGTSASRLSNYENAKTAPTTDVLGRIEQLIGPLQH